MTSTTDTRVGSDGRLYVRTADGFEATLLPGGSFVATNPATDAETFFDVEAQTVDFMLDGDVLYTVGVLGLPTETVVSGVMLWLRASHPSNPYGINPSR